MNRVEQSGSIGTVLKGRYEVLRELGRGGQGCTYLCADRARGEQVAVKELHFDQVRDWKMIELFEREARVLEGLSHRQIPAYVDSFRLEDAKGVRFYLVQEFVVGQSLEVLIQKGWRADEAQVRALLGEMLRVLEYLHGLVPPVIHRDIKPSNIMRREGDGRWILIDFGAVQRVEDHGGRGFSTIVGTSGYMPLEQLMGRSVPATDLYGLGATIVRLLSHRHPSDMPMNGLQMEFGLFVNVSQPMREFLRRMLEPYLEDRFVSAGEARQFLEQGSAPVPVQYGELRQPQSGTEMLSRAMREGGERVAEGLLSVGASWRRRDGSLDLNAMLESVLHEFKYLFQTGTGEFRGIVTKTENRLEIRLPARAEDKNGLAWYLSLVILFYAIYEISRSGGIWNPLAALIVLGGFLPIGYLVGKGVWKSLLREVVTIEGGLVRHDVRRLGYVSERKEMPVESIGAVELVKRPKIVGSTEQEVEEVVIRSVQGRMFRFGDDLFQAERAYLQGVLLDFLSE